MSVLVASAVFALTLVAVADRLGHFLVVADALAPGDAIFVPAGGTPARELEAAALYHRRLAPRIVVSLSRGAFPEVSRRLSGEPSDQERAVAVLRYARVPPAAIVGLRREVQNSEEELHAFFEWAREHMARRVILVTSPYHTRRIRVIWNRHYQRRLHAAVHPTPYEPFDPHRWWRSRYDLEHGLHELVGMAHFLIGSPLPTYPSAK